ncbi:hypothetical protein [Streptomyces mirabilis]|uniref:hypothetical protein n=1 Tax=Streptomyces mirabilis TaxID=68239 RepID=UPI0036914BE5
MDTQTGATGPGGAGDEPAIPRRELYRRARALHDAAKEAEQFRDGDPGVFAAKADAIAPALQRLTELVTGRSPEEPPVTLTRSGMGRQDTAETVHRAIELAEDLLARDFTDEAIREAFGVPRPTVEEAPLFGERAAVVMIDIYSYVVMDFTDPEALARKTLSEATRNSASETKMAVSALQYALGVSPLKLFDDTTKMLGEAVRKRNAEALKANAAWLERERQLADLWDDLFGPEPTAAPGPLHPPVDESTTVEYSFPEEALARGTALRYDVESFVDGGLPGV